MTNDEDNSWLRFIALLVITHVASCAGGIAFAGGFG